MQPIQTEHELICPGCGCVLENINEQTPISQKHEIHSFNISLLGTAAKGKYNFMEDRTLKAKENVFRFLIHMTKEAYLPESFAHETYRILLKKNKGWFSKGNAMAIKQLISILEKDDNYIYHNKLKILKEKYHEMASNF